MKKSFSWQDRNQTLQHLKTSGPIFDICIIGGGITGAAIARDASLRGLKVLLLEKNDFAYGTSSRSSKLIHGGVRYLEQLEFGLVHESTRERARLWKLAPHLVKPLPFLFPAYKTSRVPLWKLNAGLWLYDFLAMFRVPSLHRLYNKERSLKEEPGLRTQELDGCIFYWDAATDDARITLSNILDAVSNGATVVSRAKVTGIQWNQNVGVDNKQAHTLTINDEMSRAQHFSVKAKVVVIATGPWSDQTLSLLGISHQKLMAPTRGSHIVVPAAKFPLKHAVVMTHPKDGRVLFSIPWEESTIIGTTDLFDANSPDVTQVSPEEVTYLLDSAKYYFPNVHLNKDDIQSTWTGVRPLLAPPSDGSTASDISREHHIEWLTQGALLIAGGKLTTHREMAEQAVDRIYKESSHWESPLNVWKKTQTHTRPLPQFEFPAAKGSLLTLDENDLRGLLRTQMVLSLEDLLVRRTPLYYKAQNNGLDWLKKNKNIVCEELGWSEERYQLDLNAYYRYLEHHIGHPLGRSISR